MSSFASHVVALSALFASSPANQAVRAEAAAQVSAETQQALTELQSFIERFTGRQPLDCGRHMLVAPDADARAEDLRRWVACAVEAANGPKPFQAVKQNQGIDSRVFEGLLGTAEGVLFRFHYDSAPCGNSGCAGTFSIERCGSPALITDPGGSVQFDCRR